MKEATSPKHKIVMTGGHHNSALAVANRLRKDNVAEIIWYGHRHTMRNDKSDSAEYKEVSYSGIRFREIKAGKIYKVLDPIHWIRVPCGFVQAFIYLLIDRPDLIFSFGGYIAAPVVLAGWLQGIKIVTHEQTTVVGFANKFISYFADRVFITWPQSRRFFDESKVKITGLPLRPEIFKYDETHRYFDNKLPVIYVTGGKQGSHVINETFYSVLPELLQQFNVIHQCGQNTQFNDYEKLQQLKESLPVELKNRYLIYQYIFGDEIGQVFYESDLVVGRAGAHTVYEVAALAKPTLFIPIPWVSHNEQYKNARLLVNEGAANILPESRLSADTLKAELLNMFDKIDVYRDGAKDAKSKIIMNAEDRIVDEIKTIIYKDQK